MIQIFKPEDKGCGLKEVVRQAKAISRLGKENQALRERNAEFEKELLEFAKDVLANDSSKHYKNNQPRPLDGRKLPGWRRWATPSEMAKDLLKRHGINNPIGTVTDEEKANENYIVIDGVTFYKDQDKKWLEEHGYLKVDAEEAEDEK